MIVQGYKSRCSYLATCMPRPADFATFWQQVYTQRCSVIVMLNQLDNSYEMVKLMDLHF